MFFARIVAALHIAFALFALLGGFLVVRYPVLLWPHLAALAWSSGALALDWPCPLTPLEKVLRAKAGAPSYDEGFVQHYLTRTDYSGAAGRRLHMLLALVLLVVNLFAYRTRMGFG